ncbi:hypothetical protein CVD28_08755 [Bacillus sp. M6-12]|uniref:hypothetical protein n=1 Tax=Bacillus sp. M6-12 TaxID=2054166 RepID=UPI000C758FE8|nr:hypothetical protein [Bacillus sp. M6-12]PLS17782.1 hypothetical protein CVD28_08755 [Bacillus sp. M6-12]
MKTSWVLKGVTGLCALALVCGSASIASTKGPEKETKQVQKQAPADAKKEAVKNETAAPKKKLVKINSKIAKSAEKQVASVESNVKVLARRRYNRNRTNNCPAFCLIFVGLKINLKRLIRC